MGNSERKGERERKTKNKEREGKNQRKMEKRINV